MALWAGSRRLSDTLALFRSLHVIFVMDVMPAPYDSGMHFAIPRLAPPLRREQRCVGARLWALALALGLCLLWSGLARATEGEGDITLQSRYWMDASGVQTVDEVAAQPADRLLPMDRFQSFQLGDAALWMRLDLPARRPRQCELELHYDQPARWHPRRRADACGNGMACV